MKGFSHGMLNSPTQKILWERFIEIAEDRTGFNQHERGFMRAIKIALGRNLSVVANFPDRALVVLSGIAGDELAIKRTGRKHVQMRA